MRQDLGISSSSVKAGDVLVRSEPGSLGPRAVQALGLNGNQFQTSNPSPAPAVLGEPWQAAAPLWASVSSSVEQKGALGACQRAWHTGTSSWGPDPRSGAGSLSARPFAPILGAAPNADP